MDLRGKASGLCAGLVLALGVAVAPASAATVNIGSDLTGTFIGAPYNFQASLGNDQIGGRDVSSPVSGTVISWRTVEASGGPLFLQIVHPSTPDTFSASAESAGVLASEAPNPTNLPIQPGDFVALRNSNGTDKIGVIQFAGARNRIFLPALAVGAPPDEAAATGSTIEYGLQATVRYCVVPNLAKLKLAAAQAALTAADCKAGAIKKPKGKKARKKAKYVRSQSVAPGTSISDTQPIDLTLGKKAKKKKKK